MPGTAGHLNSDTPYPSEPCIFTFDFISKLKRLNRDLYLGDEGREVFGYPAVGLYRRRNRREDFGLLAGNATKDDKNLLQDLQSGARDEYLCGIPVGWVPDLPLFDRQSRKLAAPSWRDILLKLSRKGVIDLYRARRVFNDGSLGERDFDRLDFDSKRDLLHPKEDALSKFRQVSNAFGD